MSMMTIDTRNGSNNGASSVVFPPLSNSNIDPTARSLRGFTLGKSNRKSVWLNKDQMLQEYYGWDSPPAGVYNPEQKYSVIGVRNNQ